MGMQELIKRRGVRALDMRTAGPARRLDERASRRFECAEKPVDWVESGG